MNEMLSQMLFCFVFNRDNEGINGKIRNTGDISQTSFHFPGGQIKQEREQTSAPGMSKKWGKVGRRLAKIGETGPPLPYFFPPTHTFVPFACFWK